MAKIKNIITLQDRISLFQTCTNTAGSNFQGQSVKVEDMAKYAKDLYELSIKTIGEIGNVEVEKLRTAGEQNVEKYSAKLKAARSIKALAAAWSGLPAEAKTNKGLVALKDQLKKKYANPKVRR